MARLAIRMPLLVLRMRLEAMDGRAQPRNKSQPPTVSCPSLQLQGHRPETGKNKS